MSQSIQSGDALYILHRAYAHLLKEAKSFNDDALDELRAHNVGVFLELTPRNSPARSGLTT